MNNHPWLPDKQLLKADDNSHELSEKNGYNAAIDKIAANYEQWERKQKPIADTIIEIKSQLPVWGVCFRNDDGSIDRRLLSAMIGYNRLYPHRYKRQPLYAHPQAPKVDLLTRQLEAAKAGLGYYVRHGGEHAIQTLAEIEGMK